jgi:electron transfer flavoprotein alpha subunit
VTANRHIWVLPEIDSDSEEISKTGLGLLTEAAGIAAKADGSATALVLGDESRDCTKTFGQYGIDNACIFIDPMLKYFTAGAYATALLPKIREEKPWLILMGHDIIGKELAPRLAFSLETGLVSNCARIDFSHPDKPVFYRPVYGDQLYEEVVFDTDNTMLVTMDTRILNINPVPVTRAVKKSVFRPEIPPEAVGTKHLEFLPADSKTVDVADADVIVGAGMGAAGDDVLPLVRELADLINGTIGTTRPVVDGGQITRERMIGQTGKMVSPELYLALGISGASHHVGGIQASGKIVSINRDPGAPIFRDSDVGIGADLREVLPPLIEKIRQAKADGTIL